MHTRNQRQSGMSMLSALMAAAISGIVGIGVAKTVSLQSKAYQVMDIKSEVNMAKIRIIDGLSCEETLRHCDSNGQVVQLRNKKGDLLFSGMGGSVGGGLYVRTKCDNNSDQVKIREIRWSKRETFTGPAKKHPVTGKALGWKKMFQTGTSPCSDEITKPGTTGSGPSCAYYTYDHSAGQPTLNSAASCDWNRYRDACSCPTGMTMSGFDLYMCADGNPTRARCACCTGS